jgi:hypothetical protein
MFGRASASAYDNQEGGWAVQVLDESENRGTARVPVDGSLVQVASLALDLSEEVFERACEGRQVLASAGACAGVASSCRRNGWCSGVRRGDGDRRASDTRRVSRAVRRDAVREIHDVVRAATPTHERLRARVAFVVLLTMLIDAGASVLILRFERHAPGTEITNLGDAVFWTSTQLLTVSSQLPNPISTPARVLDVLLQAYAISVVAVLAGSFSAFFHRRGIERDPPDARGADAR